MDLLAPIRSFDRFQQRHTPLAIPIAVVKKFGNDQAGNLAALVAYYAFFSLFPLLLVFVTVLGFVLNGDPSALHSVKSSVLGRFPVIGSSISNSTLTGSTLALAVGVVGSLWGGLGITQAATQAFDRVWAVPMKARPNFFGGRLRGIALLFVIGALFIVASAASGLVSAGLGGIGLLVAGIVVSLLLNFALFMVSFKLLCTAELSWGSLVPGAVLVAIVWEVLQALGGVYIDHVRQSNNAYGTFALVLGVLAWLHLGAQLTLYCAEVNSVIARRLWPRSLFGPPVATADRETLTALAKVEERSPEQEVEVSFTTGPASGATEQTNGATEQSTLRTGGQPPRDP
ncbi:MAG: YihY/virulence factor BrkB family protein [Solirubrobacteraceae bacterium]